MTYQAVNCSVIAAAATNISANDSATASGIQFTGAATILLDIGATPTQLTAAAYYDKCREVFHIIVNANAGNTLGLGEIQVSNLSVALIGKRNSSYVRSNDTSNNSSLVFYGSASGSAQLKGAAATALIDFDSISKLKLVVLDAMYNDSVVDILVKLYYSSVCNGVLRASGSGSFVLKGVADDAIGLNVNMQYFGTCDATGGRAWAVQANAPVTSIFFVAAAAAAVVVVV